MNQFNQPSYIKKKLTPDRGGKIVYCSCCGKYQHMSKRRNRYKCMGCGKIWDSEDLGL